MTWSQEGGEGVGAVVQRGGWGGGGRCCCPEGEGGRCCCPEEGKGGVVTWSQEGGG